MPASPGAGVRPRCRPLLSLRGARAKELCGASFVCVCVSQSGPTLCGPIHCSPPGSCVHGALQARIRGWLPFPSPGPLPDPRVKSRSPVSQADSLALSHEGSGAFLMRTPIPFVRALPSGPNHPKVPPPYTITLDMRFSTYEFCGDTHTKSLASTYTVVLLEVYKVEGKITLTPEHHLEVPSLLQSLVPS